MRCANMRIRVTCLRVAVMLLSVVPAIRHITAMTAHVSSLRSRSLHELYELAGRIIPRFDVDFHKGQHGKVAVIGGSFEYTGAPYYAAASSLRTGSDLTFILCAPSAALAIKSYSPETIVHGVLPLVGDGPGFERPIGHEERALGTLNDFERLADRFDCVVIGPGLGREDVTLRAVSKIIGSAIKRGLPLVLDGDALFLLARKPDLLNGYQNVILTPNVMEFKRLWDATVGKEAGCDSRDCAESSMPSDAIEATRRLSRAFGGVTVLRKGREDAIVADGDGGDTAAASPTAASPSVAVVAESGSPRRCGGQGDVLAGSLGTFLAWAKAGKHLHLPGNHSAPSSMRTAIDASTAAAGAGISGSSSTPSHADVLVACAWAASRVTRTAAALAWSSHHRSMTTPDILPRIGEAFESAFPDTTYTAAAGGHCANSSASR